VQKEKLLKEIEKKNDDDIRKKLTVQIDPMKNETFLEMMKQITAKAKKAELEKVPLVEQADEVSMPESIV